MAGGIRERVSVRVSLVLAAVDDFSGRPAERSLLHVWMEGAPEPSAKEGGYYVFTNVRTSCARIHLEGPVFQKKEIVLDEKDLAQYEGTVMKVRLLPNRSYPVPRGTTCVQGYAPAHATVMAFDMTMENPLRLLYAYEAGSGEISIYHPEDMDLEGRVFCIQDKPEKKRELFRILSHSEAEKNRYRLAAPLSGSYKKIGTVLFPVLEAEADKSGEFYMPAAGIRGEKAVFAFWLEAEEERWIEAELISGRHNSIDIRKRAGK